jgi:hypothetical protein
MKRLIAAALIVCATIAVVAVTIIRHVNHKQVSRGATITATPTTPPKTASASEHAENSSKLVSSFQGKVPSARMLGFPFRRPGTLILFYCRDAGIRSPLGASIAYDFVF